MSNNPKWTVKNMPDQSGKIAIVTGANSGIGYEAARALASKGAQVVMACRNLSKGESAAAKIKNDYPESDLHLIKLDLSSQDSVKQFAENIKENYSRLDFLINNAGVMATPFGKTADGYEMQLGTNHLGHFALTALLFDLLKTTSGSRVVTVSSYVHYMGKINFDDLNSEKSYQKWLAYGQSKLANVLFGYELQRRSVQASGNPISIVVHPGYAATNLQHTTTLFRLLNPFMAQSQEMGALPTLYAATSPDIRGGEFIGPDGFLGQGGYPHVAKSSGRSQDEDVARKLWQVSEQMTGIEFSV